MSEEKKKLDEVERNYLNESLIKYKEEEKQKEKMRKEQYADMLKQQQVAKKSMVHNGSMTLHEKKMNLQDLHSYKYHDHTMNSLVLGVSSTEQIGVAKGSQALSPRAKVNPEADR